MILFIYLFIFYKPGVRSIDELFDDESSGVKHRPEYVLL